ncbi:DoxX family protein [Streptosporangium sp. DT93]|uniref:DoxX family protein n=1 Tax=Streptosporangium sp. DT93 TaxID=3393428 RepID=UPI003CF97ABC
MFAVYATVTVFASLLNGSAAVVYLIGHEFPKSQLDMKGLPRSWAPALGMVLAAGSLGLLGGFAIPMLGTLAASGLVVYFILAFLAHLRVGSRTLANLTGFLVTSVAALAVNLLYHWW